MIRTGYLTIAAIVLGAGGIYLYVSSAARVEASKDAKHQETVEEVRAELARIKRTLSYQQAPASHGHASQDRASSPAAPEDDDEEPSKAPAAKPDLAREAALAEQETANRVAEHFDSEGIDSAWEREAKPMLQRQFGRRTSRGSRITSIDCRQTMCRVETAHDDFDTYREFGRAAVASPDNEWPGGAMMHVLGDPKAVPLKAIAYMFRPGEDMAAIMAAN